MITYSVINTNAYKRLMEKELQNLQITLMHHEENIERLSKELHTQQQENWRILERLDLLEKKLQTLSPSLVASEKEETPPPHY
jgi:SlyX protein